MFAICILLHGLAPGFVFKIWAISRNSDERARPELTNSNHLSAVVRLSPLVSIDLVLLDPEGRALLGLRNNEPAKGVYFVPGGVIRKNEKMADAFARILRSETGLEIPFERAQLIGAYEHFYPTNRFNDPEYGTHYVVLGYDLRLPRRPKIELDDQHSTSVWWTAAEILDSANVHENTKAYFQDLRERSFRV